MNDDLERLKSALKAATPAPDDDVKARAIAVAQKNFAAAQGSATAPRPSHNRPENPAGFLTGVKHMFANIGLRPALLATSSLAVVGFGVMFILPGNDFSPDLGLGGPTQVQEEKRKAADATGRVIAVSEEAELMLLEPQVEFDMAAEAPVQPLAKLYSSEAQQGLVSSASMPSPDDRVRLRDVDNERFANAVSNPLNITVENPVSTFSIDVDTASYAFVRASLLDGYLPPADAVRVEEMVNYFPYGYGEPPAGDVPFSTKVTVIQTPWNAGTKLVHIGIQGEKPALADRPPLDLVFLIDTSGSMHSANKLPLLKQSFRLLLSRLGENDRVAIVTYAGSSGVVLEPTAAANRAEILAALDRLEAGGSTAGQAGLQQAYSLAETMAGEDEDRIARILLATDGDFNVGISDPEELKSYIEDKRNSGTYLSVLGFGRGNYNDALMQALAQNGNGTASYIDTLSEAQKVLVDQVSGALFPIANDVKIQVEFNPAVVAEYRLIGYETRILAREDFNNDKVDAGGIGAGHTVTALYEVTPGGSPAIIFDPLRYQASPDALGDSDEAGFLKLRYKLPGSETSQLITTPFSLDTITPSQDAAFAVAIAGFGQLLRDGKYLGDWGYDAAIALAVANKGADEFGYRAEAVTLMRLAGSLSE